MHPYLSHPGPVGFAHRGAHGDGAGENTAAAFERAVALGYRHLETDVQVTADGVLVALHDDTLDRTTDGAGPVASARWADLRRMEVVGGGRVPRFDELVAAWPTVRWNVDCKTDAAVGPLAEVVAERLDRTCLASFDEARLRRLRRTLGPAACIAGGRRDVTTVLAAARLPASSWPSAGAALARALSCDVLQVPTTHGRVTVVTEGFVAVAHAAGRDVHVWTVDEPAEQRRLLALGVDGLMSDDAAGLARTLAQQGWWPPRDADGSRATVDLPPGAVAPAGHEGEQP